MGVGGAAAGVEAGGGGHWHLGLSLDGSAAGPLAGGEVLGQLSGGQEPEAAADHQLDQRLQPPSAALAGPKLLPADAREVDHRDLAGGGLSRGQAAIHDAAQPQRRALAGARGRRRPGTAARAAAAAAGESAVSTRCGDRSKGWQPASLRHPREVVTPELLNQGFEQGVG